MASLGWRKELFKSWYWGWLCWHELWATPTSAQQLWRSRLGDKRAVSNKTWMIVFFWIDDERVCSHPGHNMLVPVQGVWDIKLIVESWSWSAGARVRRVGFHTLQTVDLFELASISRLVGVALGRILDEHQVSSEYWSWDDSVYLYRNALQIEKEGGFEGIVCHETYRNRSLFNPYAADYILQKVPE